MEKIKSILKEAIQNIDPVLFVCATLLSLISIVTIWGAVDNFGMSKLKMQMAIFVVGVFVTFFIAFIDYRMIVDKLWLYMLIGSVLLLVATIVFGESGQNMETANKSWLKIPGTGFMIQPSEFVKFTFICTFAKHLEGVKDKVNKPLTLLGLMAHAGLIVGLILLSGDLGVSLVYMGVIAVMLFCAGMSLWYFLGAIVAVGVSLPFLWSVLAPYQQDRIIYGFNPELDPFGYGMQPLMSVEAISRGGFFGEGLFGGSVYEDLAASHTDFIFATVCEKFGFLGGALVIIAIAVIVVRLVFIALSATDAAGRLICCGIAAIFILQTLENIGMCMALIPVVGITLPFMSAGGSSMLALYMIMGLAHSVRSRERRLYFRGSL